MPSLAQELEQLAALVGGVVLGADGMATLSLQLAALAEAARLQEQQLVLWERMARAREQELTHWRMRGAAGGMQ